jgi:hypothetical protein
LQEIWVVFYTGCWFCVEGLKKKYVKKIVFIFDEVMTGFRLAAGGAQKTLNV